MNHKILFGAVPKSVLFGVLNWGLGHASRSLQLLNYLHNQNCELTIASDGAALEFLKKECPWANFETLPAYNIHYNYPSIEISVLSQSGKILSAILKENKAVKTLIKKHEPELVISDSRFGFRSDSIESVIISHQINLQSKYSLFRYLGNALNHYLLNKFNCCWVPDYEDRQLSGELSENCLKIPVKYIGPLSRLRVQKTEITNDILVILSGPEPARSKLEQKLKKIFSDVAFSFVAVAGRVENRQIKSANGWYNYLLANELEAAIANSKLVVTRAGYSSIMDMVTLSKKAILIPTPGQTEQLYLAHHLKQHSLFISLEESELEEKLIQNIKFNL